MRIEGTGKPRGCKLIRISAEIDVAPGSDLKGASPEGAVIRAVQIRGDFFASPEESFERLEQALAGTPVSGLAAAFDGYAAKAGIETFGINGAGVAAVLEEALLKAVP
ncbi:MAG: hypothetical protein LBC62_00770 [Treponema sp.]|nr:hypothetical protein [Treponema sp.]